MVDCKGLAIDEFGTIVGRDRWNLGKPVDIVTRDGKAFGPLFKSTSSRYLSVTLNFSPFR